jgi:hypothetical protein
LAAGPVLGVFAALIGGILTWGVWQTCFPLFTIPEELLWKGPLPEPPEVVEAVTAAGIKAETYNVTTLLGVLGGVLGVSLAIAEALKRRSLRTGLAGPCLGVLFGAGLGALGGWLGCATFWKVYPSPDISPLAKTMLVQGIILGTLGGAAGLVLGILSRRGATLIKCLIGGIVAGGLVAILYPFLAAWLLPMMRTEVILPEEPLERLVWTGVTVGMLGLVIPGLGRDAKPRRARAEPAASD